LPDIEIEPLSKAQVCEIYRWVRSQSEVYLEHGEPLFWDLVEQRDVPITAVDDPCERVMAGRAEPFRHGLSRLTVARIELPSLTIAIWPDRVSFDYRMGDEWGPAQLSALFEFLWAIQQIAPDAALSHSMRGARIAHNRSIWRGIITDDSDQATRRFRCAARNRACDVTLGRGKRGAGQVAEGSGSECGMSRTEDESMTTSSPAHTSKKWVTILAFACLNLLAAYVPALLWVPGLPGSASTERKLLYSPVLLAGLCLDATNPLAAASVLVGFLLLVGLASVLLHRSRSAWLATPTALIIYSLLQGLTAAWLVRGIDAVGH
jgi:hypothetical protein